MFKSKLDKLMKREYVSFCKVKDCVNEVTLDGNFEIEDLELIIKELKEK